MCCRKWSKIDGPSLMETKQTRTNGIVLADWNHNLYPLDDNWCFLSEFNVLYLCSRWRRLVRLVSLPRCWRATSPSPGSSSCSSHRTEKKRYILIFTFIFYHLIKKKVGFYYKIFKQKSWGIYCRLNVKYITQDCQIT